MLKKFLVVSLVLLVIGGAAIAAVWQWSDHYFTSEGTLQQDVTVTIPKGVSLSRIAEILAEKEIISYPRIFTSIIRIKYQNAALQAGEYQFNAVVSPKDVFRKLSRGDTLVRHLTIPEGMPTAQILDLVNNSYGLVGEIPSDIKEGVLLPETYHYSYGLSKAEMIERMQRAMRETSDELWEKRQENLPFESIQQALTLASIVEKETAVASERRRVAAVFINRLRKRMRLQSDPTVIYALTAGKYKLERPLSRKDLQIPSEYNTYVVFGLPPAPIANPGEASIAAVLNPIQSNEYYFVADGSGGHAFAKTLSGHNRNVRNWRRIEREKKRQSQSADQVE